MKLTLKQKRFIIKYIEFRGNGTQAAMDVYNVKNAAVAAQISYENLRKHEIREEIKRLIKPEELKLSVFLEKLASIAQTNPIKGYTGADILKAIEIILKLHGVLTDRRQVTQVTISTDLTELSIHELLALREKRQRESSLILNDEIG